MVLDLSIFKNHLLLAVLGKFGCALDRRKTLAMEHAVFGA